MLNDIAPELALPTDDFFLARQPILARDERLVAFELLFRDAAVTEASFTDHLAATAAVIAHASQLGMEQVVGERLAFVNVDEAALMSDFVRFLPSDRVILEILETVRATPLVLARVRELREAGFRFALDDVINNSAELRELIELVDIIKIDIQAVDTGALAALVHAVRAPGKMLLAEKVETIAQYKRCLGLGFDYFQGYYFARPAILSGKTISPSEMVIFGLLAQIDAGVEARDIAVSVKRDPLISLNLLRLVNRPVASTGRRIDSIEQALDELGRTQLQRWLQILLYAKPGSAQELGSPLLQLASTRGKLIELMMRSVRPGQDACAETGFTVGIMSLTDALFSLPMEQVLDSVSVADEVRAALLRHEGLLGSMLKVVELLENPKRGAPLKKLLKELGLSVPQMREIELAAFRWVNELVEPVAASS